MERPSIVGVQQHTCGQLQQTDTRGPQSAARLTCFQFTGTDPLACDPWDALPMLSSCRSRLSRSGVAPDSPPALPMSSRGRLTTDDADESENSESTAEESRGSAHGGGSPRSANLRAGGCAANLALERGSNRAAALLPPQRTCSSTISSKAAQRPSPVPCRTTS
eukprot:COSAG02_NODE_3056_length_7455_cov_5.333469_6_plen_164_part_00